VSHNKTLIGTINEKYKLAYPNDVNRYGDRIVEFEIAHAHWLATARQWRDELQAEGLTDTVEVLNKTIAFFERCSRGVL
jgi:hypothetical protein